MCVFRSIAGGLGGYSLASSSVAGGARSLRASSMAPSYATSDYSRSALSPERALRGVRSPLRENLVNGAAAKLIVQPGGGGYSTAATSARRFMTLEDECNWILSGRDPLPDDLDESDQDDDTLDDISGDEVIIMGNCNTCPKETHL